MKIELSEFKDKHKGEPGVVLGNGPSLVEYNFDNISLFSPNVLIGTNRSWKVVRSTYHCALDWTHVKEFCQSLYETDVMFLRKDPSAWPLDERDWCRTTDSSDIFLGRFINNTGVMATQLALYMGFNPIYMLGIDLIDGEKKFYSSDGPAAYNGTRTWFTRLRKAAPEDRRMILGNPNCPLEDYEKEDLERWK